MPTDVVLLTIRMVCAPLARPVLEYTVCWTCRAPVARFKVADKAYSGPQHVAPGVGSN